MLRAIVRQQWQVIRRDSRLALLGAALLLGSVTALLNGVARNQRWAAERTAAVRADGDAWMSQGVMNPHYAAHFGHYVFKPISKLSVFDPGLLDHLGTMVRLEAHRQHLGTARPGDSGTALSRFSDFTVAMALQMFGPLLVILMGFSAFSGERARTLLLQEMGAGVKARTLLLGRALALGAVLMVILAVFGGVAVVVLLFTQASAEEYLRLVLMISGYALYLVAFLAITLGVSALCRSARSALTTLLAFWISTVLLVPRVAPAIAAQLHPAPSGSELLLGAAQDIDRGLDGDGPRAQRPQRLRDMLLHMYGVSTVEELPISFSGALLEYTEDQSTEIFKKHFADLFRTYEQQAGTQRSFATVSPLIALKTWSSALAGTDLATHRVFLTEAEEYRHAFVQALNRDVKYNRANNSQENYEADVAAITAAVDRFQPSIVPLSEVWRRQWSELAILLAWLATSSAFALVSARAVSRAT